jgi:phosphatidylinositol phospholipase C, epsilon
VLADDENVYSTQAQWQTLGRFVMRDRCEAATPPTARRRTTLREATIERLSKGLGKKTTVHEVMSDPLAGCRESFFRGRASAAGHETIEHEHQPASAASSASAKSARTREVHSEGEALSEEERDSLDMLSTVARFKKVSLRRLRVWK